LSDAEADLQKRIVHYLRSKNIFCFAPMNEAFMTLTTAGKKNNFGLIKHYEAMGLEYGVPDVIIAHDNKVYFVELKALTGKISDKQKAVHERLRRAGFIVWIIRNFEELSTAF